MIHPKFWLKHAQAGRALRGYPLYDVPHKQAEGTLSEKEARENFDYFMRVRLERLAFFQEWLKKNFGVDATLDGDGVRAVSKWVDDYGGGLIGDEVTSLSVFGSYQPAWEGHYAGYNVMIDLGIFIGAYLVIKRPWLCWMIYRGHEDEPETSVRMMVPILEAKPAGDTYDVLYEGYLVVSVRHEDSKIHVEPIYCAQPDVLLGSVRLFLYTSRLDATGKPFMFGDSSNEPL